MRQKQLVVDAINLLLGVVFAFVVVRDWRAAKREIKIEASGKKVEEGQVWVFRGSADEPGRRG